MANPTSPTEQPKLSSEDVPALLERARSGDRSTLPQLRALLQVPRNVDLLGGNLAREVEVLFFQALTGKDLVLREAMHQKLEVLRKELAGPTPTPIERLLADRAIACWMQVQDADLRYARSQGAVFGTNDHGEYHQTRMDRANTRYLSALKTLAQVRKLAVPVLQVNIAKKQVNVGHVSNPS